jgi:hypothetical protein
MTYALLCPTSCTEVSRLFRLPSSYSVVRKEDLTWHSCLVWYCHELGVCDYRRGTGWILDLLTTCIHHSELLFTVHWHTHTSVLSLLHSPLSVSWRRLRQREILRLPAPMTSCHSRPYRIRVNWQPSTNWIAGWRPFHTNFLVYYSQDDFQLTIELSHSPTSYFMSLHSAELLTDLTAARLVFSLYNLGADPTENTASDNPSIFVMGGCLATE